MEEIDLQKLKFSFDFCTIVLVFRKVFLTPLGRIEITEGEIETFTDSQLSGCFSALTLSIASLITFIPTANVTSVPPRYCALSTFLGSSMGVGNDCAVS